ncbi:hypothetical protein DL93DRAFT_2100701 [Clavulina sp. PMI_390]|nr:hypothetical protein DL93DRAFT_2100701 [Clavulina sp. PMI_390]
MHSQIEQASFQQNPLLLGERESARENQFEVGPLLRAWKVDSSEKWDSFGVYIAYGTGRRCGIAKTGVVAGRNGRMIHRIPLELSREAGWRNSRERGIRLQCIQRLHGFSIRLRVLHQGSARLTLPWDRTLKYIVDCMPFGVSASQTPRPAPENLLRLAVLPMGNDFPKCNCQAGAVGNNSERIVTWKAMEYIRLRHILPARRRSLGIAAGVKVAFIALLLEFHIGARALDLIDVIRALPNIQSLLCCLKPR